VDPKARAVLIGAQLPGLSMVALHYGWVDRLVRLLDGRGGLAAGARMAWWSGLTQGSSDVAARRLPSLDVSTGLAHDRCSRAGRHVLIGRRRIESAYRGELFEVITAQVRSGAPHDPASIAATLNQSGRTGGHRGAQLTRALSSVTIAGAVPETVGHYTVAVLSAGYRRGFHLAAMALAEAAEQLSQDQLLDHLLSIGRAQRAATERLHHGTTLLSPTRRANGSPHSSGNTEPTTSEGTTTS